MPDFLTRRRGTWHFVPREFAAVDPRGVIKHSTKIKVSDDRTGRRAFRVARRLNEELELFWHHAVRGHSEESFSRYDHARLHARSIGFEYVENQVLVASDPEKRLERLEALVTKGLVNDPAARAALLGTEKRPTFLLSKLLEEYQAIIGDEIRFFARSVAHLENRTRSRR